ncbi:hypothetical protein MPDQ_001372 [Monascus purpureus]|uniref:CoA carboxyltransferase C-terminal domain-containing protein n=1 Tax=Monascus purpureus TaxID=5098 RepID=A0A507QS15_MONPU|nr:hypothetical protein MPDQ_001372 [Monascus purpureus]
MRDKVASDRVKQVTGHLKDSPQLPADYSDILSTLDNIRERVATPNFQNRGCIKQKRSEKLWVRERLGQLLYAGSFVEIGSVSGKAKWKQTGERTEEIEDFMPANNVQVLLTADDFTIRAGHSDGAIHEKTLYLEKLALAMRLPVVKLTDGSSGGGSVSTIKKTGYSYIPMAQIPPVLANDDPVGRLCPELRTIIPRRRVRMYNSRAIIKCVFDASIWFEIGTLWGRTVIVGLARLGGRPVGVISTDCEVNGGAIDSSGSQKLTRHLKLCDVMNLPIVQLVDVPGYAIGTMAEKKANPFGVEEIIDPAQPRKIAAAWAAQVYDELLPARILDRNSGKIRPTFT